MPRQLTGQEIELLKNEIIAVFGGPFELGQFTRSRMNKNYQQYAPPFAPTLDTQLFHFIQHFNNKGWHGQLILAFLAEQPDNENILDMANELGLLAGVYTNPAAALTKSALEGLVNGSPFFDIHVFLKELSRVERCVCRVELDLEDGRSSYGTGFLVGKDLLMTNYHVMERYIKAPETVRQVLFRFDYHIENVGEKPFEGNVVAIAMNNPIVAYSPYCDLDETGAPLTTSWPEEHLDYALVRLAKNVADESFGLSFAGNTSSANTPKRGFIPMPQTHPALLRDGHVLVIQHPDKQPKKVALGLEKIIGTDPAQQRLRYEVNTLHGSSGSPCFNEKFEWIALHNMGDPSWNPTYNQGVVVSRIAADLTQKGISL